MKLVPYGTRVFFSLIFLAAPLACNQADTSGELTEYDVFEQRMIVSPTESQAGPAPAAVSPDQAPPAADRTQEAIAEEVEIRKQILGARETRYVAAGTVVAKKAFLFENPPELWTAGERPRFEILTRVSLAVTASYKDKLPGTIDFWSTCGQLDREDWQDGKPKGCLISTGVVFEPGDEVLVALQDHKPLPDGAPALRLRGGRRGASFTNTANDMEKAAAKAIQDFVESSFERF